MVVSSVFCVSDNNGSGFVSPLQDYSEPEMPDIPDWLIGIPDLPWLWAMVGSLLVGLTGVLPLLIIPSANKADILKQGVNANSLNSLLGFAVGAMLGDVFLQALPTIYSAESSKFDGRQNRGLIILTGLITFFVADKLLSKIKDETEPDEKEKSGKQENGTGDKRHRGYLNLVANTIDNFTHGLSLGGACLVSPTSGLLTTFTILVHEIPHEIGDFALLLSCGFTRKQAAIGQLMTAFGGLIGAVCAIKFSGATNSIEARTSWILPFTTGSFLHIALVTILPDLLKEQDTKESVKQLGTLIAGIMLTAFLSNIFNF